jgi:hypothetical protein
MWRSPAPALARFDISNRQEKMKIDHLVVTRPRRSGIAQVLDDTNHRPSLVMRRSLLARPGGPACALYAATSRASAGCGRRRGSVQPSGRSPRPRCPDDASSTDRGDDPLPRARNRRAADTGWTQHVQVVAGRSSSRPSPNRGVPNLRP